MLSFLKDEEFEDSSAGESRSDKAGGQQSSNDATDKKRQGGDYLTVAVHGKKILKTTHLLAVLLGVVLLGLWFMIRHSTPDTAAASGHPDTGTAQQTQIEKAIIRLAGTSSVMSRRMDRIVKKFYEFSDVPQVGVKELVKNPFKHEIFIGDRGDLFTAKYSDLNNEGPIELLSIMKTEDGNCCMINDKILYEGDSIRGFKVVKIGENFVKLEGISSDGQGQTEAEIILKFPQ